MLKYMKKSALRRAKRLGNRCFVLTDDWV